ncbi:MAG: hypothetical protein AB7O62_15940 [Pirellulales bacterium]
MRYVLFVLFASAIVSLQTAVAADYRLEELPEAAPAGELSAAVAKTLQPAGSKIIKGKSRTLCDVWFCKTWNAKSDFKPTNTVLYPFEVGQLVGAVRFKSKGTDFRGQEIPSGVYTIRYAQQPVDGNHVGTSDTLDFLLLLPAEVDQGIEPLDAKEMFKTSAKVAGTNHPTMLTLQAAGSTGSETAELRHDEERDYWVLCTTGKAGKQAVPLEVVIVGESEH